MSKKRKKYNRSPLIRDGIQTNITLPTDWIKELDQKAREYSAQEKKDISRNDLIRRSIKGAFNLRDEKFVKNKRNNVQG